MLNINYQFKTELEDLNIACMRSGYSEEDFNYLIEKLQDSSRANSHVNNTLIHEAARILIRFGHYSIDHTESILQKITGKSSAYIKRIRTLEKFSNKKTA